MVKKALRQCDSAATLNEEVESLRDAISQPETEESWDEIMSGLFTFTYLCENGACNYPSQLITAAKSLYRPINNAVNSERTKLSGAAIDLVGVLATALEAEFEPLLNLFFPNLLTLCTRSNKVFVTRARVCIIIVIECTQLPAVFGYLLPALKDKSITLRIAAVESLLTCMNCFNPPELEKEQRARDIEAVIRATARDANPDVRKTSRKVFEAYKVLLPNRVERFTEPLSPMMKKYLDIKPKPQVNPSVPHLKSAFPSLPDLKSKAKLSASTSVLPTSTSNHTTSTNSDKGPTHIRSASAASALPSSSRDLAAITKPERTHPPAKLFSRPRSTTRKDKELSTSANDTSTGKSSQVPGSMPPPDYIPVRPIAPKRPTPAVRVPVNPDDLRTRTTSTTSALSGQPMRVMVTAGTVAGAPRRVPQTQSGTTSTATAGTGPRRLNRPATIPMMMTAEGLMRPILPMKSASAEDVPPEMVVPARRVPMPEPGSEDEARRCGRSATRGDNAARQEMLASSRTQKTGVGTGPTRVLVPARASERVRTISKPAPTADNTKSHDKVSEAKAPTPSAVTGSTTGSTAKVQTNAKSEDGKAPMADSKKIAVATKAEGVSAKPGWGRPPGVPRKAIAAGKGRTSEKDKEKAKGPEKGKAVEKSSRSGRVQQPQQQAQIVKPESVPLPPSPGRTPTPEPAQKPSSPSPEEKIMITGAESQDKVVASSDQDIVSSTMETVLADEATEDPQTEDALVVESIPAQASSPPGLEADLQGRAPTPPAPQSKAEGLPVTPTAQLCDENSEQPLLPGFPAAENKDPSTPISSLLESIQRGFLMTPISPLSPPQKYIAQVAAAAGISPGAPMTFTIPPLMREVGALQFGLKPAVVAGNGGTGDESTRVALTDVGINQ